MKPRVMNPPRAVLEVLEAGGTLVVSISGGKDSQAMLRVLSAWHASSELPGRIIAVHADLGRAEWSQTPSFVRHCARESGVPLRVVRSNAGDLVQIIEARAERLRGRDVPFWMSAKSRYCTSAGKRDPINKFLRRYPLVVSAEGIRAQESQARAARKAWSYRAGLHNSRRTAITWNPLLEWTTDDVWAVLNSSVTELEARRQWYREGRVTRALRGFEAHPAYVFGSSRLSCALCMLASKSDLEVGAMHNPALLEAYRTLEERTGWSFKHGWSLADLEVERGNVSKSTAIGTREAGEDQ
jgi:3'-phosphoadenosine 5'-phosphosulfate sulfotransferase (PAPS reductase)/FAD synthetase